MDGTVRTVVWEDGGANNLASYPTIPCDLSMIALLYTQLSNLRSLRSRPLTSMCGARSRTKGRLHAHSRTRAGHRSDSLDLAFDEIRQTAGLLGALDKGRPVLH